MTQILKANFDNLQENNILDSSGKIDIATFHVHLDEGVKKNLPEIYQKAQDAQQIKSKNNTQKESGNSLKENVDFSNPEETKKYFDNLFNEYSHLKTFDEKLKFFNDNFYDISHLQKQDQKIILNSYETGNLVAKKESQNLEDGFSEEEAHSKAVEDTAEEIGKSKQTVKKSYQLKCIIEKKAKCYKELSQPNLSESKRKEIEEDILNFNQQEEKLRIELGDDEQEIIINETEEVDYALNIEEIPEKMQNNEINNLFGELDDETLDMNDIFGNIDEKNQLQDETSENIEDLFGTIDDDTFDMNDLFGNTEQTQEIATTEDTYINPIMSGVSLPSEDLQSEYIHEVEQNPLQKIISNIRTRSFNNTKLLQENHIAESPKKQGFFSRIKNAISKFINKNEILAIDTAENNTKTDVLSENSFANSIAVNEEVKNNVVIAGQKTNLQNKSIKKSNEIETNSKDTISM